MHNKMHSERAKRLTRCDQSLVPMCSITEIKMAIQNQSDANISNPDDMIEKKGLNGQRSTSVNAVSR